MLRIREPELLKIREHAEREYPNECCGVLLGRGCGDVDEAVEVVPCRNIKGETSATEYEIDPKDLIRVQREAREKKLEVLAYYHSHPDYPALWSQTDLQLAYWSGTLYVIVAVNSGVAGVVRAYRLIGEGEQKRFEEEAVGS